jgi:crotonobetainyl-CoA:carnitine CoA-transferase CaiB-like acyl-CoA transferase
VPVFINTPIAGYAQGVVGAVAAAAALYARARTGAGDVFEVNGIAAAFAYETTSYVRGEGTVWRSGQVDPRGPIPTYRLVQGSDGEWLFAGALTPPFWTKLAVVLGIEDCLVDERFAAAPMGITDVGHRDELAARVDAAFATKTRDEWLRILEEEDIPRAPVCSRDDYARDPQVLHQRLMVDLTDPELGPTRQMGIPVTLRSFPGDIVGPAPKLDQHAANPWRSAARSRIPDPNAPSRPALSYPLQDITILDLGGFIAGANATMMLADLGANVIKVESPEGDGWRSAGLAFLGSNRGKRSCVIDLKKARGRALFLDLAERADVVLDNMRAGTMERLGVGYDELRARNPRIVHTSVTGYGAGGPYAHLPGFDPLMQARSGIMRAQGERDGEPVFLQVPVCDYTTALTAAFGTIVALVARERTGAGDRVETSLLASAFTVQAGEFIFYAGKTADPPGGRDLHGRNPAYRIYATSDGYISIACTDMTQVRALASAIGLDLPHDALARACESPLADEIGAKLGCRTTDGWLDALLAAGVPAAPCLNLRDLYDSPHIAENDLWYECDHPQYGHLRQTGAVIRWARMSMHLQRRAPLLGEHTDECIAEMLG